jgi:hypothetical protein
MKEGRYLCLMAFKVSVIDGFKAGPINLEVWNGNRKPSCKFRNIDGRRYY